MATNNPVLPDYSHLGVDIDVTPDLNQDEQLRVDADCLLQDLVNGWTQNTGLADGTAEGAEWGVNLLAQLGRGFTKASLFALKVAMEAQAERDDRVSACTVALTVTGGTLQVSGTVYVGQQPYPFSFTCTNNTVQNLYIARLG
jgi:hypothetical protein